MRAKVWTCDRCGATVSASDRAMVHDEDFGWMEHGCFSPAPPDGWQVLDSESAQPLDVCPECLTDAERADILLGDIELTHETDCIFGADA